MTLHQDARRNSSVELPLTTLTFVSLLLMWRMSGIQPDVVDDTVRKMVQESLGTNDFKLVKRIPKGKDQRTLTFIPFNVVI